MKTARITFMLMAAIVIAFSAQIRAEDADSTFRLDRDPIGDLNATAVRKGEAPGFIRLPGTDVDLAIGGFIKATAIFDSKYNVKNEIITPGGFSSSDFFKGQSNIGAKSSRLFFDGRSTIDNLTARGYFEMDFRGPYGFTLRHAYLSLGKQKGWSLLMGQYWSLAMDLRTIPEGLVEPTMSAGPFARHGQIRFAAPLSKITAVSFSVEEPNTADIKGDSIRTTNKFPDFVGVVSLDPTAGAHFSVMGLVRPIVVYADTTKVTGTGYLLNAGMVLLGGDRHRLQASAMYGNGASNYVMGADGTAGFVAGDEMELQKQYGGFAAYRYIWSDRVRSNIAFGRFATDKLEDYTPAHIRSSIYAFVNSFYRVNRYVNVGIEYVYTEKTSYNGGYLNNHRIQLGIQIF